MTNVRFLWDNLVDVGTVDASSEEIGFEAYNVQNELFLKHWRSQGWAGEWLCVDLSASGILDRSVRAFAIKYHNLELASGDDYRILGSDGDLCGSGMPASGEFDQAFDPTEDVIIEFFATAQDFLFWKVLLDSAGSKGSGEYQKIGRLFLGDYFEPTYDVTTPPEVSEADDSDIVSSRQGQDYANVIEPYEFITYNWKALPASDIAALKRMFRAVGRHKPFFICEDADQSGGAYTVTRYVKNIEAWTFGPVTRGYASVSIRVKTER